MTVEAAGFIDDIDPTQPPGTDNFSEGDDHLRNFKKSVQDSFPNISGAMTADEAELNSLDGYTGNTADLNILSGADTAGLTAAELQYVKGVTSDIQTQLDAKETYVQSVTGPVAANALTAGLGAGSLNFRSSTLTSGAATNNTHIALSVIVPSTATLGTTDAVESDIILLAINNAGTTELAVVNSSGTVDLNEKALISTTAIGTGSDSADVAYSTTARSNVAFRVVGLIRSTQATAGTWVTSPSLLQGHGGNVLASYSLGALSSLDSVSDTEIDADSVGNSELKTAIGSSGTQTLTAGATWTPAAGFYNITQTTGSGGSLGLEIFTSSAWRTPINNGINALVWFDGTNMRIKELGAVSPGTLYWQKLG